MNLNIFNQKNFFLKKYFQSYKKKMNLKIIMDLDNNFFYLL
jgi:hypothetical protein